MAKSPARAHRRDPDRTREAILAAAQHEFATKGLSGGRVDAIARRARANKRMIYHYFGNKDGLYLAALERVYEDLRGTEKTLDLAHLAPEAAIRRLVEFTFDYSRRHPELISLINNENLHRARHLRKSKKVRELHSPFVALIDDILRARRGRRRVPARPRSGRALYHHRGGRLLLSLEQLDAVGDLRPRPRQRRSLPASARQHNVDVILNRDPGVTDGSR